VSRVSSVHFAVHLLCIYFPSVLVLKKFGKTPNFLLLSYVSLCINVELRWIDLKLYIWQSLHNVVLSCLDGL
jgi:hypothetical protein